MPFETTFRVDYERFLIAPVPIGSSLCPKSGQHYWQLKSEIRRKTKLRQVGVKENRLFNTISRGKSGLSVCRQTAPLSSCW